MDAVFELGEDSQPCGGWEAVALDECIGVSGGAGAAAAAWLGVFSAAPSACNGADEVVHAICGAHGEAGDGACFFVWLGGELVELLVETAPDVVSLAEGVGEDEDVVSGSVGVGEELEGLSLGVAWDADGAAGSQVIVADVVGVACGDALGELSVEGLGAGGGVLDGAWRVVGAGEVFGAQCATADAVELTVKAAYILAEGIGAGAMEAVAMGLAVLKVPLAVGGAAGRCVPLSAGAVACVGCAEGCA